MTRFLAFLLLFAFFPALASAQYSSVPYLDQKHFPSRSKALSAAVFLENGSTLATGSLAADSQGAIQLWTLKTGDCTGSLMGPAGGALALAVSRDGKCLAAGGDGLVAIYEVASRKETARTALPAGRLLALAFAPNGSTLSAAGEGKQIHLLDCVTGKALNSFVAHDEAVTSLAFAPDGNTLFSGSYDGSVKGWDVAAGKLKSTFMANGGRIHGVAVSADGKSLAAACAGSPEGDAKQPEVALWNLENSKQRKSLHDGPAAFTTVRFSGTDGSIAAARADGWIVTWSAEGRPCARLRAHLNWITSLSFSPDGGSLVSTSWEPEARLWDLPRWKTPVPVPAECNNPAVLAYDSKANLLITGGVDKAIHLIDPSGKKPERQLPLKADNTQALAVSSDGKFLVSTAGRPDGMPLIGGRIRAVRFGVAAPQVVKPEGMTLWDLVAGKELRTLAGHQGLINVLAFSPDALLLASGSADKTVRIWNVAQGTEQMQLIGHTSSIVGLAFHPNGKTLVSASDDGSVRVWDLHTGHEKRAFQAHPSGSSGLAYSNDGRWLTTCSSGFGNGSLASWDAETGENRWLLPYSRVFWAGLTVSPNGRFVLALEGFNADAGCVHLIDAERGRPRLDLLSGKTQ
ncbi:MAG TPA: WD40 repeat domain-containing protein, partial [Gemmataceae bacterium]|nr:WD40 repeat domain-containing protein [Gemmataceae bacterium]